MADQSEPRPKGISPPLCKVCRTRHWGTCADQTPGGYLAGQSARAPAVERLAVAKAIVAGPPKTKRKDGKKRK